MRVLLSVCVVALLAGASDARCQGSPADPADVSTIEAIVHAYYDVLNGPPGVPRQWRRDSTLYMPGAMFVGMREAKGWPVADIMAPDEFRRAVDSEFVARGFFETEIGRRVERFGNVAQVRSVYETRQVANGPVLARGVNYLLLYWDGRRWWITSAVWDDERPGHELPASWIGRREKVP